jgi:hypothetical protein
LTPCESWWWHWPWEWVLESRNGEARLKNAETGYNQ